MYYIFILALLTKFQSVFGSKVNTEKPKSSKLEIGGTTEEPFVKK